MNSNDIHDANTDKTGPTTDETTFTQHELVAKTVLETPEVEIGGQIADSACGASSGPDDADDEDLVAMVADQLRTMKPNQIRAVSVCAVCLKTGIIHPGFFKLMADALDRDMAQRFRVIAGPAYSVQIVADASSLATAICEARQPQSPGDTA